MSKTSENVLIGVATLSVGAPSGNRAEWSNQQAKTGSYSVKLSKEEAGDYGSTGVQFNASGNAAAQTINDFQTMAAVWGWDYFRSAIEAYWEQLELRFEDPDTGAWVDVTVQVDVMALGTAQWETKVLVDSDVCFFGGWSEGAGSFSNWAALPISGVVAAIEAAENAAGGDISNAAAWVLTRIKSELWETVWSRYVYIDDIVIDGTTYTLEPGGDTEAILFSAPATEVGYTEDGVTVNYTATTEATRVEEETFQIGSTLSEEMYEVVCNMAEASLFNMDKAMAGSVLSGSILKLGGGAVKYLTLIITGINPAGFVRTITIPKAVATGAVGSSYRKSEKTVVPVTFQAVKTPNHPAVTIVDNAA